MSPDQLAASLTHYGAPASSADVQLWERGRNIPPLDNAVFVEALAASLKVPPEKILRSVPLHKRESEPDDEPEPAQPQWSYAALEAAAIVERLAPSVRTLALDVLRAIERGVAGWRLGPTQSDPWA